MTAKHEPLATLHILTVLSCEALNSTFSPIHLYAHVSASDTREHDTGHYSGKMVKKEKARCSCTQTATC